MTLAEAGAEKNNRIVQTTKAQRSKIPSNLQ
jgi:hypothetical protein